MQERTFPIENIPQQLRKDPQWVNFLKIPNKDDPSKIDKKPVNPMTLCYAKPNDPNTWGSFDKALQRYLDTPDLDGIGRMFKFGENKFGADLDGSVNTDGSIKPWALEIISHMACAYIETSISGTGIHIIGIGKKPGTRCKVFPNPDNKKEAIELYETGRFFTFSGNVYDGHRSLGDCQEGLNWLTERWFPEPSTPKRELPNTPCLLSGERKERLDKAFQSKNGGEIQRLYSGDISGHGDDHSAADMALASHLAFFMSGDATAIDSAFRASGLMRPKWDVKHFSDGRTYGEATVQKAIAGCHEIYNPANLPTYFSSEPTFENDPETTIPDLPVSFPDIMQGVAGEFADTFSKYLEPPSHFFYVSFLTCLGSFIPISLESELRTQPRLFCLLLGQSADDRKSTAIIKTVDFFHDTMTEFNVCYGVGSGEGLQKKLKESPKLLLCLDELNQFIKKCKIEGSVLLPFVNTLFESNRYEAQTKHYSIDLHDVHLSMLAASTIPTYERTWDASFTDIGFTNRLFIVPGSGERRFSFPERIPDIEKFKLQNRLAELLKFIDKGFSIGISKDGRELFHGWYLSQGGSVHSKRLDTYALRFMMLLAVNDFKREIDSDTVQKVIQLMDWELAVRRLHDPIDCEGKMAVMEERIRRILQTGSVTDRELQRRTHSARVGSWVYQTALKNLHTGKQIQFKAEKWSLIWQN